MSDKFLDDKDEKAQFSKDLDFQEINTNKSSKTKLLIILALLVIIILIVVVVIIVIKKRGNKSPGSGSDSSEPNLEHNIKTVELPDDIIYLGSHYNYQGQLFMVYQKKSSDHYFLGICNEEGKILRELYEIQDTTGMDTTYIQRASSFSDGKRVLVAGKILQCTKEFLECDDAKLYDVVFPEEIKEFKNLLYTFSEPIVNYGGNHVFWSTFDKDINIVNFVGKLVFKDDKYYLEDVVGLSSYFYDLYDKEKGTFSLPDILRYGPIKQVINGGEALSIGGFLNYGLRKGIYQSLSEDKLEQLTMFEGYDETTTISPDSKLACVMTTRFSPNTSLEIVGMIPTPYSILASYLFSLHLLKFSIAKLRLKKTKKGNLGPALVDLNKVKKDKEYKGYNLTTDENWVFNGFISWSPDGKKIMFDETNKIDQTRRCQIVYLKNYKPGKIEFKDNYKGYVPYNRSIEETINLHLDYPMFINVTGKTGYLEVNRTENKCEINYYNYSKDGKNIYDGVYIYEKFPSEQYAIFEVDIKSTGEKKGYGKYRLWFDLKNNEFLYDKGEDGKEKTYGDCEYEGKKINVDIYKEIKDSEN